MSFLHAPVVNWFPGHMARATRDLVGRMKGVDLVVELRDARIPFSSANPLLDEIVGARPRVVLFNKADLANPHMQRHVVDALAATGQPADFVSSAGAVGRRKRSRLFANLIDMSGVHAKFKTAPLLLCLVGVPNVGKSSMLNALRHAETGRKASAKVGALPGVTRLVAGLKVCDDPLAVMLDSPGVMLPRIDDPLVGLRLALTGAVRSERVDPVVLVDYLLHELRERKAAVRVARHFAIDETLAAEADVHAVLAAVAHARGEHSGVPARAAEAVIAAYRAGQLGRYTLDPVDR